jgi:hypothetical protein
MLYTWTKEQAHLQGVLQEPQEPEQASNPHKKFWYEAHHNDACYTSNDNELCISADTPVPSEDPASASSESKTHKDENYHPHFDNKLKAGSHVPCKSDHQ